MQANLKLGFGIGFIRRSPCKPPTAGTRAQVSSWAEDNSRPFSNKSFLYRCKSAGPMSGPLWQMTLAYSLDFTPTRSNPRRYVRALASYHAGWDAHANRESDGHRSGMPFRRRRPGAEQGWASGCKVNDENHTSQHSFGGRLAR